MIKSNQLRIGNWVEYPKGENIYYQVAGVTRYDVSLVEMDGTGPALHRSLHGIRGVSPIPLTAEILEKAGFGLGQQKGSIPDKYDHLYEICDKFYFSLNPINMQIHSVHQLQNLYFALTGEELEIQL